MIEILRQILMPVGAVATLATLPGALELLLVTSGSFARKRTQATGEPDRFSLAIIVPAHNEEVFIGRCVESLLASAGEGSRCAVVVVADNCTDATADNARLAGARVLVRENAVQRGKGFALRFAFDTLLHDVSSIPASAESFDGFLVVDADSIVSANLIPAVIRSLASGSDAVQTRYRVTQPLNSNRKRLMDVALLAFNVLRPLGRHGWGLSAGILGNGFALHRKTLQAVPYSADSIVEDLEYHLLLVDAGKRVDFIDAATVYGDMPTDTQAQESQRARWEGGRARVAMAWIPKLTALLCRGKLGVAEPLIELLTLPLAYLALLALLLCVMPFTDFRIYGMLLVGLLIAHVAASVALGGNVRESLSALASAPGYIFWKLTRMGSIIRSSRRETQWLRTPRSSDAKPEVPRV